MNWRLSKTGEKQRAKLGSIIQHILGTLVWHYQSFLQGCKDIWEAPWFLMYINIYVAQGRYSVTSLNPQTAKYFKLNNHPTYFIAGNIWLASKLQVRSRWEVSYLTYIFSARDTSGSAFHCRGSLLAKDWNAWRRGAPCRNGANGGNCWTLSHLIVTDYWNAAAAGHVRTVAYIILVLIFKMWQAQTA